MVRDTAELVFCALGGIGEIGMNMALYGYGSPKKRQWLMVDCGVSFAGPDLPGVDLVMPDTRFIEHEKKNLVGMVITHAHEGHFGALIHLWPKLGCPVYATRFTAALLEANPRALLSAAGNASAALLAPAAAGQEVCVLPPLCAVTGPGGGACGPRPVASSNPGFVQ